MLSDMGQVLKDGKYVQRVTLGQKYRAAPCEIS